MAEPATLTEDMKRIVREQRLGFVATIDADGSPNLSPKGTFVVLDDHRLAFGDIRSPNTTRNLKANPSIEINFVDAFVRKGYRFKGTAEVVGGDDPSFADLIRRMSEYGDLAPRMRAVVVVTVMRALPLSTPAYDPGPEETEIRRLWTARFRALQPDGQFLE